MEILGIETGPATEVCNREEVQHELGHGTKIYQSEVINLEAVARESDGESVCEQYLRRSFLSLYCLQ